MYVKAAANASIVAVKGGATLDQYDAKLIQCRVAISRLTEILRILRILEGTLKRTNGTKTIIPLMNYILALYGGLTLNASEILSRRLRLLSEFRLCKITDVNPPLNSSPISLDCEFPEVSSDFQEYTAHVYDRQLQNKLLQAAINITQNALQVYDRKYKQCNMERSANMPTSISGRPTTFEEGSFEELIQPLDVPMILDLAVLIKDFEVDTSESSFRKLSLQVLTKFKDHFNEKALPPIKTYHTSLFRFSKASSLSQSKIIMNLPYWQYTMHRIYALLLRILYILTITKAFLRQAYIPNRAFFESPRTQLHSPNVFEFRELLKNLDTICMGPNDLSDLVERLQCYSQQGFSLAVQPSSVLEAYNSEVSVATRKLRFYFQIVESLLSVWKHIQASSLNNEAFGSLDELGLSKAVEERLAVDRLDFIERKNKEAQLKEKQKEAAAAASTESSVKTIFRRSSIQRSKMSPSPSGSTSPSSLSPASMSRSPSQNLKRGTLPKKPLNGSSISSPLASRRGSVSGSTSNAGNRKPSNEGSSNGSPRIDETLQTGGRKRSSSLQSSVLASHNQADNMHRSNSLQAGATLNQRMVRNTFAKLSANIEGNGALNSDSKTDRLATPANSSRQMMRSSSPSPLRQKGKSSGASPAGPRSGIELPDVESLVLDEGKLALVSKQSPSGSTSASTKSLVERSSSEISPNSEVEYQTITLETVKKVRFTGVPPMSEKEDPRPKRKGWYKKPQVLHYPPPPPQVAVQQYRLRQEGQAFRKSLRDGDGENGGVSKRTAFISQSDVHLSPTHKFSSKIRDKLSR